MNTNRKLETLRKAIEKTLIANLKDVSFDICGAIGLGEPWAQLEVKGASPKMFVTLHKELCGEKENALQHTVDLRELFLDFIENDGEEWGELVRLRAFGALIVSECEKEMQRRDARDAEAARK